LNLFATRNRSYSRVKLRLVALKEIRILLGQFRNFNNDAVVLMRLDNLSTIEGIETFRDLNFEFQLDERVESILSIFSLVKYGGPDEGWQSALPAEFNSDEEVLAALQKPQKTKTYKRRWMALLNWVKNLIQIL